MGGDDAGRKPDPSAEAVRLHSFYRGKIRTVPKVPVRGYEDFALWYTPGVAAPCREIRKAPERVWEQTNRANSIAIVSDGTRVLGLGDIGPEAGLPVMEGKALLFSYLGGVDAVPLCLRTSSADELVETVARLEPSFGGINLEDIAQPRCFRVLDVLRERMDIPVWHDDQQGTATVVLAGLVNALEIVDKPRDRVRVALVGVGAAGVATYRMLVAAGVDPGSIVACDTGGTLHAGRHDLETRAEGYPDKWRICTESNADGVQGGIAEALRGADVCLAFSSPGPAVIRPEWVREMARDAVVFACANPVPEIWPDEAKEAGARIVCTGRSDFPNQVNNSLAFPGIFRGTLDVRARTVTDGMALAAATELADCARERGLRDDAILPRMDEAEVVLRVALATARRAQEQGVARVDVAEPELRSAIEARLARAREALQVWMREGIVPPPPER